MDLSGEMLDMEGDAMEETNAVGGAVAKHTVRIHQKQVWVGDQAVPLISGEVHYWRMNPDSWREALRQFRHLGLQVVATYVCWEYHQLAPGTFDFDGGTAPQRDLVGFIEMVASEGLWLIIRPGPYIYSEWHNGGIPDEAVPYHRLHSEFHKAAERYMAAVVESLTPYFASNGGPIILLQAENEVDPWPQFYEESLGLGQTPGLFHDYLCERYETIDRLNKAWESEYADFGVARAVLAPAYDSRGYANRYLDFCRFRHWFSAECVRWTARTYRDLGVDVPIFTNVYINNGIQNWPTIESHCDFAGPDYYPTGEFRGAESEHRAFLHILRFTRAYSALPYIPEFEAGIWHGGQDFTGLLTTNHYLMIAVSALLAGVAGWNWYMLVERDNWLWSPVNALGCPRPDLFAVFGEIVRLFNKVRPHDLEKLADVGVTVDVLYETARQSQQESAVLQALYEADIDYECFDVEAGEFDKPVLFYAGESWLSADGQRRLREYVENGGSLVCFQDAPRLDDSLEPLNLFGFPQPDGILSANAPQRLQIALGDSSCEFSPSVFFTYEAVPGEPIVAERVPDVPTPAEELRNHSHLPVGKRYVVGYRQALGQGSVIHLGVAPSNCLVTAILRWLAILVQSRAVSPHGKTALFRREGQYFIVLVNAGDDPGDFRIDLDSLEGDHWQGLDLITGHAAHFDPQQRALYASVPGKSGTIIRLEPV
jgi:hypothetical protein